LVWWVGRMTGGAEMVERGTAVGSVAPVGRGSVDGDADAQTELFLFLFLFHTESFLPLIVSCPPLSRNQPKKPL